MNDSIFSMAKVSGTGDPFESLFYVKDTENKGIGIVECQNFTWDREKSNLCVSDKGFSFYYARLVYNDEYALEGYDFKHSTHDEDRYYIVGTPFQLENQKLLMVVESDKKPIRNKVHIISVFVLEDLKLLKDYENNKRQILSWRQQNVDTLLGLMRY